MEWKENFDLSRVRKIRQSTDVTPFTTLALPRGKRMPSITTFDLQDSGNYYCCT